MVTLNIFVDGNSIFLFSLKEMGENVKIYVYILQNAENH